MSDPSPNEFGVLAFFVADHAEAINGKLYVHGGYWNRIAAPSFPLVMPPVTVVAMVEVPFGKYQSDHHFTVELEDLDGHPAGLRVDGDFRVGAGPEMDLGEPTMMPLAMPVQGMTFERPGRYSLVLYVNGNTLGRYPLRVIEAPPAPAPPA